MRRVGQVFERITSFDNLMSACRMAARGKRDLRGVARFLERREHELLGLQRELQDETYRPGDVTSFLIQDPKERRITVAPFRDRVVHHALIDPLEACFDRRMIATSFACRRGKGQHRAIRHAQAEVRRYRYFLKLDIRRFFPSLRHEVVLETLGRILKDPRAMRLCGLIVASGGASGRGLPIGHLSSQWFANLVLDRLDHFVKEKLRAKGYLRYMDDFVLFADDRAWLREAQGEIGAYLGGLEL
ncbi:MAG: reverse transcriptase/maturase family protein, partial [Myxococcota bacterium]